MSVEIARIYIAVVIARIPPVNVVDIPIVVIVNAIVRNLPVVHPQVPLKILMVKVYGIVNHTNNNGISAGSHTPGGHFPGTFTFDIRTRYALTAIVVVVPL